MSYAERIISELFDEYSDYVVLKNSEKEPFAMIITEEKRELLIKALAALISTGRR